MTEDQLETAGVYKAIDRVTWAGIAVVGSYALRQKYPSRVQFSPGDVDIIVGRETEKEFQDYGAQVCSNLHGLLVTDGYPRQFLRNPQGADPFFGSTELKNVFRGSIKCHVPKVTIPVTFLHLRLSKEEDSLAFWLRHAEFPVKLGYIINSTGHKQFRIAPGMDQMMKTMKVPFQSMQPSRRVKYEARGFTFMKLL